MYISLNNLKAALQQFKNIYCHDHDNMDTLGLFTSSDVDGTKTLYFDNEQLSQLPQEVANLLPYMKKSIYDADGDGVVDTAKTLDGLTVSVTDLNNALDNIDKLMNQLKTEYAWHTHTNLDILNKFGLDGVDLTYNGVVISGTNTVSDVMTKSVYDKNNDGILDTADTLSGMTVSVETLNYLQGLNTNIMNMINSTKLGYIVTGTADTYAKLLTVADMVSNDAYIVSTDETKNDQQTIYVYNGQEWVYSGIYLVKHRDFSKYPLNLSTESTGVLADENIPSTIARKTDLHTHTFTEEELVAAINKSHTHSNMSSLNKLTVDGDKLFINDKQFNYNQVFVSTYDLLPTTGATNTLYVVKTDKNNGNAMSIYYWNSVAYIMLKFENITITNNTNGITNQLTKLSVKANTSFDISIKDTVDYNLPDLSVLKYTAGQKVTKDILSSYITDNITPSGQGKIKFTLLATNIYISEISKLFKKFKKYEQYQTTIDTKKALLYKDETYYTLTANVDSYDITLVEAPQLIEEDFFDNGFLLSDIDTTKLYTLLSTIEDNYSLVVFSSSVITEPISYNYIIKDNVYTIEGVHSLSSYESIDAVQFNTTGSGGTIKILTSIDNGTTWKGFNGTWVDAVIAGDTPTTEEIIQYGVNADIFRTITKEQWMDAINAKGVKFIIYASYEEGNTLKLTDISIMANAISIWNNAVINKDYNYKYSTSDTITVTVYTAGDYKINYCEFAPSLTPANKTSAAGSHNVTTLELAITNLLYDVDGDYYYYTWTHNQDTYSMVMSAIDSDTKEDIMISRKCVDNNVVDIITLTPCNMIVTIVM